ncbi:hypothetical protein HY383_00760 [Candidatus Daviesbacteria bacterium]|nr:hypothetical protein [Candidatus Daviesbacteria bacterium]
MTLTQTAILVKQVILVSSIALVLGLISFIGYKIWYSYYLANLPPVEEKPDTKFGLLPLPNFPTSNVSTSNFSYSLDTTTGGLPKIGVDPGFDKIIKVYFVTQTFATLLSPDKSYDLAEKFDIKTLPEILSETKYRYKDSSKTLLVDLDSGNFSYTNEATISAQSNLDEDNKLTAGFENVLSSLGLLNDTLTKGRTKINLLKKSEGKFVPTQLRPETEAIQISLWPEAIDGKLIFTPDYNKSLINATIVGPSDKLENYLSLKFTYYPIDLSTFATYSTKTTETAFEELKQGKGVIIIEPPQPQVSITSVSMGYFLSESYNPYLQPIFIFEGPNFVAYVSAVSEQLQSQTN